MNFLLDIKVVKLTSLPKLIFIKNSTENKIEYMPKIDFNNSHKPLILFNGADGSRTHDLLNAIPIQVPLNPSQDTP